MPPNHSFRSHHQEGLLPFRPEPARKHPEELVKRQECWRVLPALQYRELLTKRQVLQQ